jgi:hypothetical protein
MDKFGNVARHMEGSDCADKAARVTDFYQHAFGGEVVGVNADAASDNAAENDIDAPATQAAHPSGGGD